MLISLVYFMFFFFFFNDTATTEIYTLSLHDALPITRARQRAERTLQDAENRLDRLGPFRGGRRRELLGDVARSHTAVRMADERLAELAEKARELRTVPPGPRAPQRPATGLLSATSLGPELDEGAMEL